MDVIKRIVSLEIRFAVCFLNFIARRTKFDAFLCLSDKVANGRTTPGLIEARNVKFLAEIDCDPESPRVVF